MAGAGATAEKQEKPESKAEAPDAAAPSGPDSTTNFQFAAKVFSVAGAYFGMAQDGRPALFVRLGELRAAVSFPSLRSEFAIADDSSDGRLLTLVEQALGFVKQVRPGDSIPSELLDGSASWGVDERHHAIARGRLAAQLAAWLGGGEASKLEADQVIELAEDADIKQRVQKAFDELAEKLGIGRERRQEVVDKIDGFAAELAYIEGLRDRYAEVQGVARKCRELGGLYKRDRTVTENLIRIRALMQTPLADFDNTFEQVEAQTCEIMTVLRKFPEQVAFVRRMRDELRRKLLKWDELIELWKVPHHEEADRVDRLVRETYGFLARNYSLSSRWASRG
jgi:hypothetical protein